MRNEGATVDLAHFASDYAYKLYADHVKHEYENQIDVVWKKGGVLLMLEGR